MMKTGFKHRTAREKHMAEYSTVGDEVVTSAVDASAGEVG
jgi:hypothetical protein